MKCGVFFSGTVNPDETKVAGETRVSTGYLSAELPDNVNNEVSLSVEGLDGIALKSLSTGLRDSIFTTPVRVETRDPLIGMVKLTRTYARALPEKLSASFACYDDEERIWLPADSTLSEERKTLTAEIPKVALCMDVIGGSQSLLDSVADKWESRKRIFKPSSDVVANSTKGLGEVFYRAPNSQVFFTPQQTECNKGLPEWVDADTLPEPNNEHSVLLWCAGIIKGKPDFLEVKIANNRNFPLILHWGAKPNFVFVDNVSPESDTFVAELSTDYDKRKRKQSSNPWAESNYWLTSESRKIFLSPGQTAVFDFSKLDDFAKTLDFGIGNYNEHEALALILGQELAATEPEAAEKVFQDILECPGKIVSTDSEKGINTTMRAIRSCSLQAASENPELESAVATLAISGKALQYAEVVKATPLGGTWAETTLNLKGVQKKQQDTKLEETKLVYYRAVSRDGKVQPGFTVKQDDSEYVFSCSTSLKLSEDDGIVQCGASAQSYIACYTVAEQKIKQVYCASDPEKQELTEITGAEVKENSKTEAKATPWKIELEDGTKCLVRFGGAGGTAADGRVNTYYCRDGEKQVVALPQDAYPDGIKTVDKVWYAQMGEVGNPGDQLPPPEYVPIKKAYFAAYAD
ncbi:MAG: hypothetical protein Q4A82_06195 [Corynebacterium sp.]|nr:hypothetical protein [Corynebacterium sp.]